MEILLQFCLFSCFLTLKCDCNGNEPLNGLKSIAMILFKSFFQKTRHFPIFPIFRDKHHGVNSCGTLPGKLTV